MVSSGAPILTADLPFPLGQRRRRNEAPLFVDTVRKWRIRVNWRSGSQFCPLRPQHASLTPVEAKERIQRLDVRRGFAPFRLEIPALAAI